MNKNNGKRYLIIMVAVLAVIASIYLYVKANNVPQNSFDFFASCIKDKEAKLYGTKTCTYCKSQKSIFGESAKFLPYIECSGPGGRGTNYLCKNNNIKSYPTWVFADDSRHVGELSLKELAEKTGCEVPN